MARKCVEIFDLQRRNTYIYAIVSSGETGTRVPIRQRRPRQSSKADISIENHTWARTPLFWSKSLVLRRVSTSSTWMKTFTTSKRSSRRQVLRRHPPLRALQRRRKAPSVRSFFKNSYLQSNSKTLHQYRAAPKNTKDRNSRLHDGSRKTMY